MSSTVGSDPNPEDDEGTSLGVRFAESSVGRPIVRGLLFVTGSFWLTVAAFGVLLLLAGLAMSERLAPGFVVGDGVMAGITGVFGFSAVFVGLFCYAVLFALSARADQSS